MNTCVQAYMCVVHLKLCHIFNNVNCTFGEACLSRMTTRAMAYIGSSCHHAPSTVSAWIRRTGIYKIDIHYEQFKMKVSVILLGFVFNNTFSSIRHQCWKITSCRIMSSYFIKLGTMSATRSNGTQDIQFHDK